MSNHGPYCQCTPCRECDDHLEALAEARKDARENQRMTDAEMDRRAGYHYPEGP